jgi:hypothetical protein
MVGAMKTATLIKDSLEGYNGHAAHYLLSPGIEYERWTTDGAVTEIAEHVIVSAVDVPFSGPETLVFSGTPEGEILYYFELAAFLGELNHRKPLEALGYEIR